MRIINISIKRNPRREEREWEEGKKRKGEGEGTMLFRVFCDTGRHLVTLFPSLFSRFFLSRARAHNTRVFLITHRCERAYKKKNRAVSKRKTHYALKPRYHAARAIRCFAL